MEENSDEIHKQGRVSSSTSCEEEREEETGRSSHRSTSNPQKTMSKHVWNVPHTNKTTQNELQNMSELKDSMATMANMFKEFMEANRREDETQIRRPKSGRKGKKAHGRTQILAAANHCTLQMMEVSEVTGKDDVKNRFPLTFHKKATRRVPKSRKAWKV